MKTRISTGLLVALTVCLLLAVHRPAAAQKLLAEGVQDLATEIAAKAQQEQKQRIAVLPFRELDGNATVLGSYLAEELVTHLFNIGGFDMIERTMLDRILGELKLGQTGLIDAATAKEVGKVAGVDAVVTGTVTDLQSFVAVNCRLIDVTTGRVFAAAQIKIVKDADVRKALEMPMHRAVVSDERQGSPVEPTPASGESVPSISKRVHDFIFSFPTCVFSGGSVVCELTVENAAADRELSICCTYNSGYTRLFDDEGNEYPIELISLANKSTDRSRTSARSLLISGVETRVRLSFDTVWEKAKAAKLVEISCNAEGQAFVVQFRDVLLQRQ